MEIKINKQLNLSSEDVYEWIEEYLRDVKIKPRRISHELSNSLAEYIYQAFLEKLKQLEK